MRARLILSAMVLAAFMLSMGGVPSVAVGDTRMMSERPMGACELRFQAADIGGKGYLSEWDLRGLNFGSSLDSSRGMVASKFATMDEDGNGMVTPKEYCDWRAPVTAYPYKNR